MENRQTSVWSQVLGQDWEERKKIIDWMSLPSNHGHVAQVMTLFNGPGYLHWPDYARDTYLDPLAEKRSRSVGDCKKSLTMLAVGAGDGSIEEKLITEFRWPLSRLVCAEYDSALVEFMRQRFKSLVDETKVECHVFDLNKDFDFGQFDVVFFCHSLHHASNLDRMLKNLNSALKPDGLLLGLDYFGPVRLQLEPAVKGILDEIFRCLPPQLRVNLAREQLAVDEEYIHPSLQEIAGGDPSEAPRSCDLRSLLLGCFPVVEVRPMGGTILRPLLAGRAGNFDSDIGKCFLGLVQLLERKLIEGRLIQSDNLFVVAQKSSAL